MTTEQINKFTDLIKILREAQLSEIKAKAELNAEYKIFLEESRTLSAGQRVDVFKVGSNILIGSGIVGSIRGLMDTDAISVKRYAENTEQLKKHAETIYYEVFAIKKSLDRSEKHFLPSPHFMPNTQSEYCDYYIKAR